jgi:hypothetical protein
MIPSMLFLRAATVCGLFLLSFASTAAAQGGISEGIELLQRAEFESAVQAFDRAEEANEGLTREDLVELYIHRAGAQLALQQGARMRADLRKLATLEPNHEFGPETRPEMVEAFEALGGGSPIALGTDVSEDPGGVRVSGEVSNDGEELVRRVRVRARVGDGDWQEGEDALVLPAAVGGTLEYVVEAVGPGGAVLANEGTITSPATHALGGATGVGPDPEDPLDDDDDDDSNVGVIVGVIAGVAAVALIVAIIAIAASSGNDQTMPDPPMIFD